MSDDDESAGAAWALFEEPHDFRPPTPPPTEVRHTCKNGEVIPLRLVGTHPLWGHYLWNAAPTLSTYLEEHPELVRGKYVLELGAAAGLPSIVAAKLGARGVVATDYPDPDLMHNLEYNLQKHGGNTAQAVGYIWGAECTPLLAHAPDAFDTLLLSDLIFNHQAHPALVDTLDRCMRDDGRALVFFSHHRPHLSERDLGFFALAAQRGYVSEKMHECVLTPMFPDDPGDAHVRATVHAYVVQRCTSK